MKFAFISTSNSLKEISSRGQIEFCLAPYALRDENYKNYFINAKKEGRFVMMDNGVAEGDLIDNDDLVNLAIEMKIDELIIPDTIGNKKQTEIDRKIFLEKYYDKLKSHNVNILSVIQGENLVEYYDDYYDLEVNDKINTIGIPFRMNYAKFNGSDTKEENCTNNRIMFLNTIKGDKQIHCLGCNSINDILLIDYISRCDKKIRSIDSKLIARYGYSEEIIKIDDVTKPKKKLYVTDVMTEKQIKMTVENINNLNLILELIHDN